MDLRWKARDWYILAGLCLLGFGYDLNIYLNATTLLQTSCDQNIELILWGDDCRLLQEKINSVQVELIIIGIVGAFCFFMGTQKKDDDVYTYKMEVEEKPTNWFVNIVIGIIVVAAVFVIFYMMAVEGIKLEDWLL